MDRPNYRKVNVRCCGTCTHYIEPDVSQMETVGSCNELNQSGSNYTEMLCVCDNYEKVSTGSKRITKYYLPDVFNYFEDAQNSDWMENKVLKDSSLLIQKH